MIEPELEVSYVEQVPVEIEVAMNLTETQLDRIYAMLPIEEKALAVQTALTAERS